MTQAEHTGSMSLDGARDGATAPDAALILLFPPTSAGTRGVHLSRGSTVIGRAPLEGGFKLDVQAVSRSHAAVEVTERGFVLKDLGSRNGTRVGGKPVTRCELTNGDVVRIGDAVFVFAAADGRRHLEAGPGTSNRVRGLVGGYAMARVSREVEEAVASGRTVLVTGETGVGKELVARGVHELSRRSGSFVALNCAAIPDALVESELFGHARGAFTGASRDHAGLVRSAHGGTLFLDEIGDMPLESQAKLLRFLETQEVVPVGDTRPVKVDVRVVSATHRDLGELVARGAFRGDLYARLFGYPIRVPSLRERKEDLHAMVCHALAIAGATEVEITASVMERVGLYDWPFNVRELVSVVGRAASLADGGKLRADHFPEPTTRATPAAAEPKLGKRPAPKKSELEALLTSARGNVSAVARALDRDAALVYRWLKQHDLDPDTFRNR